MVSGSAAEGKRIVVRVAIIAIVLTLLPTLTLDIALGGMRLPIASLRLVFTLLLCFFLIRGWSWARAVSIVVFGILGVASLAFSLTFPGTSPGALALVVSGAAYLYCVGMLVASEPVREFFAARRSKPPERSAP